MSNSFPVLGFDIGGTKIAVCLAMSDGKILASGRVDNRMRKPDEVLPDLVKEGKRLLKEAGIAGDQLRAIGIDSPSPMDFEKGLICSPCNMNGWDDVPIRDYLAKEFQTEAFFDNDANGAGLAEWIFGAGQGCKNMLYLTMSTGIGGGIICNGKLVRGSKYLAGEVGHFCLDPHGPKCNCGLTGCYEAFCGGLATANHIREELAKKPELSMITKLVEGDLSKIDNAVLEKAVRAGDDYAVRFWEDMMEHNAQGIGSLMNIFDPEVIVLGTIAVHTGDLFMKPLLEKLPKYTWPQHVNACKILPSKLGRTIGELSGVSVALNFLYERGEWQLPW